MDDTTVEANAPPDVEANGHYPPAEDEEMLVMLRRAIGERRARITELQEEIDRLMPDIRRYEKALSLLSGTAQLPGKPRKQSPAAALKSRGKSVSPERIALVEEAIREYAEDHDEFRQVDIRGIRDGLNSSLTAVVFDLLRQRQVIRLARVDGNNKFYRLTRKEVTSESKPA